MLRMILVSIGTSSSSPARTGATPSATRNTTPTAVGAVSRATRPVKRMTAFLRSDRTRHPYNARSRGQPRLKSFIYIGISSSTNCGSRSRRFCGVFAPADRMIQEAQHAGNDGDVGEVKDVPAETPTRGRNMEIHEIGHPSICQPVDGIA